MPGMEGICADLEAEHGDLEQVVASLDAGRWDTPTPAEGWSIRDQVAHLAFFDGAALTALTDPAAFDAQRAELLAALGRKEPSPDVAWARALAPDDVLAQWKANFRPLLDALVRTDPRARIPWYGPAMSAVSFATARLMETWAHGQDVADALRRPRRPTDRLRHVAHIGVAARPFSYQVRGRTPPDAPVRVELSGPSGATWTWGDADATDRVRGPALDFALVVTQRRHVADTALTMTGPNAKEWMEIAQAFAGPPGPGRQPDQFLT